MHDVAPLIKDLAIILGVASIVTLLFQRIRQPVVLGYLIAGAIIGPYTPPYSLISDTQNIKVISELGVIFLMFSLGLEFSFHKLKRVGFSAGLTGCFEVFFMLSIGFSIGRFLLKWSPYDSLFLGSAMAISSTTIIIKALDDLKLKGKRFAELIFGVLIVEDLLAILLLVALSTLVVTHQLAFSPMLLSIVKLILVIGAWFLLGYFLIPSLFRRVARYASEETLTIVSIALCLFLVCVAAYFQYSTALGAFIMGSILAETPFIQRIETLVRPIRDIFGAVFFVSVGMLIDFRLIADYWPTICLIAAAIMMGKIIFVGTGALLAGQSVNSSARVGFSLAQVGEFSFIIAALGIALQATTQPIYPIIIVVSAMTTFTTPYLIKCSGYVGNYIDTHLSHRTRYFLSNYSAWVYRALAVFGKRKTAGMIKLFLNGVIVAVVFIFTQYWILPYLPSKSLVWLIALVLSSPFIWGMLSAGRGKAVFVSGLITIFEISILSMAYFQTWFISIVLLLVAIAFFRILYTRLEKSYKWFESRWLHNFENRSSRQFFYRELAPWDTQLSELHVSHHSPFVGKTLDDNHVRQKFEVNIVAIYRNGEMIVAPRGQEKIFAHDVLIVLGHDEKMDEFVELVEKTELNIEEPMLLEKFALAAIVLEDGSEYIGQSIRDSKIREKINGLVVGLERGSVRILNPDVTIMLEIGDLLLIVGEATRMRQVL